MRAAEPATRTYRGSSLDELRPKILADLGPDAVITRWREGITGGIAGFFGRRCVEIEASAAPAAPGPQSARPAIPADVASRAYATVDDAELVEAMTENPLLREVVAQAAPFAQHLAEAARDLDERSSEGRREPHTRPARPPVALEPPRADELSDLAVGIREALLAAGLPPDVAESIVDEVERHVHPFAPGEAFTAQVRRALARRIRVEHGWTGESRTIALVGASGSGRTLAAARLCRAYAASGIPVAALSLEQPADAERLRDHVGDLAVEFRSAATVPEAEVAAATMNRGGLVVVDTPPVSLGDPAGLERVARLLTATEPEEVHLVVSASTNAQASTWLFEALDRLLAVDRLLITHLDDTATVGEAVGLSLALRRPISYVAASRDPRSGLRPADPLQLAALIVR